MSEKKSPKNGVSLKKLKSSLKQEALKDNIGKYFYNLKSDAVLLIKNLKHIGNVAKNNYNLGRKHFSLGNYGDSIFRFKFVTVLEPDNYNAWYWLAASYIAVDNKPQAINSLNKAIQIKPDFTEAKELLKAATEVVETEEAKVPESAG